MKERPILFSGEMVRAILDGRKTQTRRVVKPQPDCNTTALGHVGSGPCVVLAMRNRMYEIPCPYGQPGDRLWVKETFYCDDYRYPDIPKDEQDEDLRDRMIYYRADGDDLCQQIPECDCDGNNVPPWRPSIFMPRWASRITLEITGVRVERLQEISEDDAKAEGSQDAHNVMHFSFQSSIDNVYRRNYASLWDSINGKMHPWTSNPWVWVIEFNMTHSASCPACTHKEAK